MISMEYAIQALRINIVSIKIPKNFTSVFPQNTSQKKEYDTVPEKVTKQNVLRGEANERQLN